MTDWLPFPRYLDHAFCFITDFSLSQWLIADTESGFHALRRVDMKVFSTSIQANSIFRVKICSASSGSTHLPSGPARLAESRDSKVWRWGSKNDCAGDGQQQFTWPTDTPSVGKVGPSQEAQCTGKCYSNVDFKFKLPGEKPVYIYSRTSL
jgi:hypothetical protein